MEVESHSPAIEGDHLREAVGIETFGGVFTPLLQVGCTLPCETTQTFSTAADGQTEITLALARGAAPLAADNHSLGRFVVMGIPAAPRGKPLVAITFRAEGDALWLSTRESSGAAIRLRREP